MWSALVGATTSDERALQPDTPEGAAGSNDVDGAATQEGAAEGSGGWGWGTLESFGSYVQQQIAVQAASLEEEQVISLSHAGTSGSRSLPS